MTFKIDAIRYVSGGCAGFRIVRQPMAMNVRLGLIYGFAWACLPTGGLSAQESDNRNTADAPETGIVVTADRLRGQLDVEQAPIIELNETDIEAVGATSVAELLEAISPQTGSARGRGGDGRPVYLVNGLRIGSFRELRSYPPEAVAKVEVLPEEVAQRFGFPPDRRVVNMILKDDFSSREIELELESPDSGGYWRNEQEFTLLNINDGARFNLNLEASDVSLLTEAERGIIQPDGAALPGDADPGQFRSLIADSVQFEGSANWAKALIESGTSLGLNATAEYEKRFELSGIQDAVTLDPIERRTEIQTFSTSGSLSRAIGRWQLTATADGTLQDTKVKSERAESAITDISNSDTITLDSKATLRGALARLPAGDMSATVNVDVDWKQIDSDDTRTASDTQITRRRLASALSVVVPVAERGGAWGAIGALSANFSAGYEDLSDFGTLFDWTAGLTWKPARNLTLTATRIVEEASPSLTQLGAARVVSPNVPTFDFLRGETVLATIISGGNPDLLAENQRDWKISANWELPFWDRTRFSAEYIRNRSSDVTRGFPTLTDEIEAAFPDRVFRDGMGQLLALDSRPLTFAETRAERLVFGLTTRGSFGQARPDASRAGRGSQRAGIPRFGRRGRDGRGRYFVNLTHTVELDNSIMIASGLPRLDVLDGEGGGGTPRHTASLEAGMFRNGWGIRMSGRYIGNAKINGGDVQGANDLKFNDLAKFDMRVFTNLGRILNKEEGFIKNFRVSLRMDNIFDAQRRVTDENGNVPLSYQPDLIDPTGRYLGIDLRKMF